MLSLNQIKMQTFPTAGRGAYRSADVDAFMQQVYVSFTELMSENTMMKKRKHSYMRTSAALIPIRNVPRSR